MKVVVVDKNYGSVSAQELAVVQDAFKKVGMQVELCHYQTEEEIIAGCQGAIAILGTGNPPISRKVMGALPELKFIQRFGAGVNSIDLEAATELGKIVLYIPGFCAKELADLATAMIMGLVRNMAYYDREIRVGKWPKCQYLLPGDVREMTLGLFGFGAAVRHLHDIFHGGFQTKIIAYDPYASDMVKAQYPHVEFVSFDALLEKSDIISIHSVLTPETTHAFNKETFQKMKNTAMIINTSRGPIINQKDLAWALETGEILYAGLDTMEKEPIEPDDPLLKLDNVILNPHSGSYGIGSKKTQIQMVCELIPNAITTGKLTAHNVANRGILDKQVGYEFI